MASLFGRLFGATRGRRNFIAVDIGSHSSVRSLLFEERGAERIALQKHRFELPQREREEDLIPLIDEYLRRLLFQYVRSIRRVPTGTLIGLGSHFTRNEVAHARRDREKPDRAVRADELQSMLDAFVRESGSKESGGRRYTLAHLLPFRVSLDGYAVPALTSASTGKRIELNFFATYVLDEFWERLARYRTMLGGIHTRFVSNQAAIAAVAKPLLGVDDALFIKVGAAVTEITLIREGAVVSASRFDGGGDSVTRAIAERMAIPLAEAERLKRQRESLALPAATADAITVAARESSEQWLQGLVGILREQAAAAVPERVYMLGGGALLPELRQLLSERAWYQEFTFLERLSVVILGAEQLAHLRFRNSPPPLAGPGEVALAALVERVTSGAQ